jgi:hypothetical protein
VVSTYALDPAMPVLLRWAHASPANVGGPGGRAASIRIHGRGPLSELLVESLRCSGARVAHSSQPHAAVSPDAVDLVVTL